jgi:hypothetical protein
LPIKNAITIVESDNINLADVFIQIIRLAYKIKHLNNIELNGFKQYAINSFNKRWEEFEIDPYLLAYFLHPSYRGWFFLFISYLYFLIFFFLFNY